MTTTRIKLTGPADNSERPAIIDMTPTWAGIMPALIAALQDGTPTGKRLAAAELNRLAAEVDGANAEAKEAATARPEPIPSHLKTACGALAAQLRGYAESNEETHAQTPYRRAIAMARAAAFYHAAGDAMARGGGDYKPDKSAAEKCYSAHVDALTEAEAAAEELRALAHPEPIRKGDAERAVYAATWGNLAAFAFAVLKTGQEPTEAAQDNLPGLSEALTPGERFRMTEARRLSGNAAAGDANAAWRLGAHPASTV